MKRPDSPQPVSLIEAIIPVASLILLVGLSYFLFGDAGAVGPNQVALVVATHDRGVHRLAPRPLARRAGQGRRGQCRHRHRRDLHPVRRGRADRHLGAQRHAGGDGLLRAAAAEPQLLLRHRLRDLRPRRGQHRQLVDGRRHHRRRLHGHRRQHGAQPGHCRGRGDLGRLFRRQVLAALGLGQSGRRGGRGRSLPAHSRNAADLDMSLAIALAVFFMLGEPGDYDATDKMAAIQRRVRDLADPVPAAGRGRRAGAAPVPAVHGDLPGRHRRRRARRVRGAGARHQVCRRRRAAGVAGAAEGRLARAGERLHTRPPASRRWTCWRRAAAWTAC